MDTNLENTPWKVCQYHLNDIQNYSIELHTFVSMTATPVMEMTTVQTVFSRCADALKEDVLKVLLSHICGIAIICRATFMGNFYPQEACNLVGTSLLLLLSHFSCVQLCATPETVAHQAPPSLGFSRQEHWSGLPCPSPMHESEKRKWSLSVVSDS